MTPFLIVALVTGCLESSEDTAARDTDARDTAPISDVETGETADSADPCEGVPLVDWNNFGQSFILHNCQGCHASYTADRHGAPDDVTFDTVDETWDWADRILARSTGDDPTMPPQGGVSDDDRVRLEWWLTCTPEGS